MRCEDCIPLIEEYFDGEVDERKSVLMGAHLSACADCAAALDALSFEQEIYARYDRGLEVTPALWARVSAEIAREPLPEQRPERRRPFLSGLRNGLAAAFAALAPRTALASSLALLILGVTAGSLWLSRKQQQPAQDRPLAAANGTAGKADVTLPPDVPPPPPPAPAGGEQTGPAAATGGAGVETAFRPDAPRARAARAEEPGLTEADVASLLSEAQQGAGVGDGPAQADVVNHAAQAQEPFIAEAARVGAEIAAADARLLNPAEKDVARHVEQAQMLLRSIKNARAADDSTVNVAYEKQLSRRLLAENATLQLEAEVKGDKDTKQVLDQIEPFLLDIANMRDKPSREEVRSIRERVKKDEIIAALQVY